MRPPHGLGAYAFTVLSSLRASQLMRGCTPKIEGGAHKPIVIAQLEVRRGAIAAEEPLEKQAVR